MKNNDRQYTRIHITIIIIINRLVTQKQLRLLTHRQLFETQIERYDTNTLHIVNHRYRLEQSGSCLMKGRFTGFNYPMPLLLAIKRSLNIFRRKELPLK